MNEKSPLSLLKETFAAWVADNAMRLAAALAFYTVWSIGPLLLVVISVAALVFGRDAAQGQVVDALRGLVGQSGAESIQEAIVHAHDSGNSVLANVVGIVSLLVAASGVFGELKSSLNVVWDVTPKPGTFLLTLKQRFLSLTMVLGTGFLLLVTLLLSAGVAAAGSHLTGAVPALEGVLHVVQFVVSLAVTTTMFTLMFKVIPDAKIAWRRRLARRFHHRRAVHHGPALDRFVPRQDQRRYRLRVGELAHGRAGLDLFLVVDFVSGSRVHPDLRQHVRLASEAQQECRRGPEGNDAGSRRRKVERRARNPGRRSRT